MADYGVAVDKVTRLDARFAPAPPPGRRCGQRYVITSTSCAAGIPVARHERHRAPYCQRRLFVSCYHLTDHIDKDLAVPQPVRHQVRRYVNNNSSLKLAADIANTHKHSERRSGERACSITGAKIHPAGAVVTFTWTDAQGGSHHEDCLDLAERAVNAWSAFLRSHNL